MGRAERTHARRTVETAQQPDVTDPSAPVEKRASTQSRFEADRAQYRSDAVDPKVSPARRALARQRLASWFHEEPPPVRAEIPNTNGFQAEES